MLRNSVRPPISPRRSSGFSIVELAIVLAIATSVAAITVPTWLSYGDTATLQAAAQQLASTINLGRQLAITGKTPVCVDLSGRHVRFRMGGCGGDVWTGAVTDPSGAIAITEAPSLEASANARVVFTALGSASPGATYVLTHARNRTSRAVVVAGSGRISIE